MKYYIKRLLSMNYKKMFEVIDIVSKRSNISKTKIFFDMIKCSIKYKSGYMDYYVFCFEDLTDYQRSTFITRGINNNYIKKLNDKNYYDLFNNKVKFNEIFKKYLKRKYLYLDNNYGAFKKFTNEHKTLLAKPIDAQCGKGIEKIIIEENTNIKKLYNTLISNSQLLVEEYVVQSSEMNRLFPNSVNTLRLVTSYIDGETTVLFRSIRIGNKDNVVDNFNHGGMYSVISETGIITKPAIDKLGNIYKNHPVTNTKIVGFKIPYFKEALDMVIESSKVIKEVGLVGWDIAITDNGPLMIEGNQLPGYDIYQSKIHLNDDGTGLKPVFDKVIYKK